MGKLSLMRNVIRCFQRFALVLCVVCFTAPAFAQSTVRIATPLLAQDPDNPYRALTLPSSISSQIMFDPLVVIGGDGQAQPWLVTSWESTGSKVWRLSLRQDVMFSNGVPMTANAIVESVAHMKTLKGTTETVGSSLANIERVEAISDFEVDIILKQPDPMFPWRMAIWRLPEPETWKVRRGDPAIEPAANTGSFRMTDKGEARSIYEANPRAWNPPAVDRLELNHLPDQTARLQAMHADGIDIALQMGAGDREVLESIGGRLVKRQTGRMIYMSFAKEHLPETNPVHDRRVRLAFNYGVNRQRISDLLLDGLVEPQGQLVLPGAPGHVADLEAYPYDPEKARALLAEAGYGDGLEISIRVPVAGADDMLVLQQVAENLRQVGVTLTLLAASPSQMTQMLFNGDYRADMFYNFGRGLDPLGDYRYRSCIGQTGTRPPYFCDEVSLEIVRQAQQATDIQSLNALMQAVTRREYENPPGVFLWRAVMVDALGPKVEPFDRYGDYYDYIPYHALSMKEQS